MAGSLRWRFEFSEKWKFRSLLILLFLLGMFLAASPEKSLQWILENLLPALVRHQAITEFILRIGPKIGEALVIAAVIAVVVDEAAKRKLLKEFAEDISTHIIGRSLPAQLREHIHQYLVVDFVRYNWEITYTLEIVAANEEFVQLKTKSVYEMENRSSFERHYTVEYEVEESWAPQIGATRITFMKVRDLQEQRDLFELRDGNASLKTKNEEGYVKLCLDKSMNVPMPAYNPASQHRCRFEVESVEYFRNSFVVSFETFPPVLGMTLTVLYPQDKLKVALYLSFAGQEGAKESTIDGGKKWTINRPILPGQGFNVRWDPVVSSAQAPASLHKAAQAGTAGTS